MFEAVHVVAGRFLAHMAFKKKEWKLPKGKAARDEVLLDFVEYCLDELRVEVNFHAKKERPLRSSPSTDEWGGGGSEGILQTALSGRPRLNTTSSDSACARLS